VRFAGGSSRLVIPLRRYWCREGAVVGHGLGYFDYFHQAGCDVGTWVIVLETWAFDMVVLDLVVVTCGSRFVGRLGCGF
jgi:hypothetical protein